MDHVAGKVIVITGAAGGFGRIVAGKAAARGARVVLGDVDAAGVTRAAEEIAAAGGQAIGVPTDVTDLAQMKALVAAARSGFGAIDVMINNAGVMPLGFIADHEKGAAAWARCIDINIKGVLHGMIAAHDAMIEQGRGHVINISSIYGNFPVTGAAVYGASKAAVNFLSESLRVETQGKIKVTIVKPTGVPATGLSSGIVNPAAAVGILGQNMESYATTMALAAEGKVQSDALSPESIRYLALAPEFIADAVIHAIDQPWGVSIGDITVRAAGDAYIL